MAADAGGIAQIHVLSWQATYRGHVPDEYLDSLSADLRETIWSEILRATAWPSTGAFVLESDDRTLVGFAHISASRDSDSTTSTGEVTSIYLLPAFWGAGHGRALLDRATESLREAGFSTATLWVLDSNARARKFYELAGWSPDRAEKVEDRGSFVMHELRYRRHL